MKKILIFLILNLLTLELWSQSNSPNYQQVYDFQVGDIFLYKDTSFSPGGDGSNFDISISYTKYEILTKITKNDTVIYTRKINDQTIDTITYIDSTTNILNAKNDTIVELNPNLLLGLNDTVFVKVRIISKDIVLQKIIGGYHNYIYDYNHGHFDSTLTTFDQGLAFMQVYEQGLGLVNQRYAQNEIGNSTTLIGYRKGNDTIGSLTVGIQIEKVNSNFQVYPNPCRDKISINSGNYQGNNLYEIYNLQGILVKSLSDTDNSLEISTSDLLQGIYILKIFNSEGTHYFKIIKQ